MEPKRNIVINFLCDSVVIVVSALCIAYCIDEKYYFTAAALTGALCLFVFKIRHVK